jgi:hypothetical protein
MYFFGGNLFKHKHFHDIIATMFGKLNICAKILDFRDNLSENKKFSENEFLLIFAKFAFHEN